MEPFDSFWEGPEDIDKGFSTFTKFYKANYMKHIPADRSANVLSISCGPGYMVELLRREGYTNVLGIDSDPAKIAEASKRGLNCVTEEAFPYLENHIDEYDLIFCESEINHLTKDEILDFIGMCRRSLREGGTLICHSMNGANPLTGAEGLALNIDHYNTFTEYSMRQIMEYNDFEDITVIPLKLFVFYTNPLNYIGMAVDTAFTLFFRLAFTFYGKSNKIFTKKIAAVARK